jgi:hypothetical protein
MSTCDRSRGPFAFIVSLAAGLVLASAGLRAAAEVAPDEARLLARINPTRALGDLKRLSKLEHRPGAGLGAGTVVSGSPEERALAAEIAREMKAIGLDVRTETYPVRAYRYGAATLMANGKPVEAISLHAAGAVSGVRDGVRYASGNEQEGRQLRAALVDAGDGYEEDYARIGDVRGKVVLVRRELRDWPPAQITEAAVHGARAILFHGHPGSDRVPDALRQDSMWGHEFIPALAISHRSGAQLREALRERPVEVVLRNSADIADGHSQNVVGMIRGTERPDEWVVVSAHYDRWFEGAADNTSGVASVLEIARAVAGSGMKPRRSMLFIAAGSEEAGQEDPERDWLAGSYAFMQAHPEVIRNAALIFNIDLLGWSAPKATLHATADVQAVARAVVADLGVGSGMEVTSGAGAVTDAWNFGVVGGAATAHVERINEAYFPIYHTQEDAFREASFENLGMDLRVLTLSLWRAANVTRLPISLTSLADSVAERVRQGAERAPGVPVADLLAAIAEFRSAAEGAEAAAAVANGALDRRLMAIRHDLVPWLYAVDDDFDQVVRTTAAANRVQALDAIAQAVSANDRPAAVAALRTLYEGRQCLRLSPNAYARELAFWTADGGWASRYGQRQPPPGPGFEALCARLGGADADPRALASSIAPLQTIAVADMARAASLMATKLRFAALQLRAETAAK